MHILHFGGSLFTDTPVFSVCLDTSRGTPCAALLFAQQHKVAVRSNNSMTHVNCGANDFNFQVHCRFRLLLPCAPGGSVSCADITHIVALYQFLPYILAALLGNYKGVVCLPEKGNAFGAGQDAGCA